MPSDDAAPTGAASTLSVAELSTSAGVEQSVDVRSPPRPASPCACAVLVRARAGADPESRAHNQLTRSVHPRRSPYHLPQALLAAAGDDPLAAMAAAAEALARRNAGKCAPAAAWAPGAARAGVRARLPL